MVCVLADKSCHKLGSGLAPSEPELDSIAAARSQVNPREDQEEENQDKVFWEIQELLDEPVPSRSKDNWRVPSLPEPKVGMNTKKVKKSRSSSKIADSRVYTYNEIIECQEKLNDSVEFQFSIDDVEKDF